MLFLKYKKSLGSHHLTLQPSEDQTQPPQKAVNGISQKRVDVLAGTLKKSPEYINIQLNILLHYSKCHMWFDLFKIVNIIKALMQFLVDVLYSSTSSVQISTRQNLQCVLLSCILNCCVKSGEIQLYLYNSLIMQTSKCPQKHSTK